jgi:hypothetical protein
MVAYTNDLDEDDLIIHLNGMWSKSTMVERPSLPRQDARMLVKRWQPSLTASVHGTERCGLESRYVHSFAI